MTKNHKFILMGIAGIYLVFAYRYAKKAMGDDPVNSTALWSAVTNPRAIFAA